MNEAKYQAAQRMSYPSRQDPYTKATKFLPPPWAVLHELRRLKYPTHKSLTKFFDVSELAVALLLRAAISEGFATKDEISDLFKRARIKESHRSSSNPFGNTHFPDPPKKPVGVGAKSLGSSAKRKSTK